MDADEITVVKAFVAAINSHDVSKLVDLMTEDHTFIEEDTKKG